MSDLLVALDLLLDEDPDQPLQVDRRGRRAALGTQHDPQRSPGQEGDEGHRRQGRDCCSTPDLEERPGCCLGRGFRGRRDRRSLLRILDPAMLAVREVRGRLVQEMKVRGLIEVALLDLVGRASLDVDPMDSGPRGRIPIQGYPSDGRSVVTVSWTPIEICAMPYQARNAANALVASTTISPPPSVEVE